MDCMKALSMCHRRRQDLSCVLVVVDRLSKDRIYELLVSKSVNDLVEVMHRRVFCAKGLPRSVQLIKIFNPRIDHQSLASSCFLILGTL
jgi:hypothetical protein